MLGRETAKGKDMRKKEQSPAFRRKMAENISNKLLRYVSELKGDEYEIIGKNGYFTLKDGVLSIYSADKPLFRGKPELLEISELMSLEGAVIEGPDLDGNDRKLIAYYVYYRPVT